MSATPPPTPPAAMEANQRLERLQIYLKQDSDNLSLRSQAIAAAVDAGAWDVAEQLLQEGLERHPQEGELHAHAGFICLRQQSFENARQHFTTAIANGVQAAAVRYNLAFSHFLLGQYQAAIDQLQQFAPQDDALRTERSMLSARCLHHLGHRELAITTLQDLPTLTEEADGLLALLLHEIDRTEDALAAANRVLTRNPTQLEALLARAGILVEQERFEQAEKDYQAATQAHPFSGRAWSGLAQIDFRNFRIDEALNDLKRAVAHMPNHIGSWHMLAWAYLLKGQIQEAKHAFEQSYEIDRNFGETHGGLAVIAAYEDQPKLAEEHIKRATRLNPNGFAARYAQMVLLEKEGKSGEAKQLFAQVMATHHPMLGFTPEVLVKQRMAELAQKTDDGSSPPSTVH